jgi:hypothetical protein
MSPSTKAPTKTSADNAAAKPADKPKPCTPFSVSVKILTPDDKKEIQFGITKGCNADDTAFWIIDFTLKVKKGNEMKTRVEVHITIGKDKDKAKAEALAALIKEQKKLPEDAVAVLVSDVTDRAMEINPKDAQDDPELRDLLIALLSA